VHACYDSICDLDETITTRTFGHPAVSGGNKAEGVRRLAAKIGRPRSTVSDECRRLVAAGQITMNRGDMARFSRSCRHRDADSRLCRLDS
jgi:hypothetical protein